MYVVAKSVTLHSKKEYALEGGNLTKTETYCYSEILSNRQKLRGYEVFYENISPIITEIIILETCAAIVKGFNNYIQVSVHYKTGFIQQSISYQNNIMNV
jgi:hypothetical protein